MNIEKSLIPLTKTELMEINGGGFAYDAGRVIRFVAIALSEGVGLGTTRGLIKATVDAAVTNAKNKS